MRQVPCCFGAAAGTPVAARDDESHTLSSPVRTIPAGAPHPRPAMAASPNPDPPDERGPAEGPSAAPDDAAAPDAAGSPVGEAFAWASRILAIGLAMFLPGVGGTWLDARLGTRFLGPVGLIFGFTAALFWLVQIGNSVKPYRQLSRRRTPGISSRRGTPALSSRRGTPGGPDRILADPADLGEPGKETGHD